MAQRAAMSKSAVQDFSLRLPLILTMPADILHLRYPGLEHSIVTNTAELLAFLIFIEVFFVP